MGTGMTALLLTDVVGSTAMWQAHPGQMSTAMARHHEIVAEVVAAHDGRLPVDQGEGDARFAVFGSAIAAVAAAVDVQRALAQEPWPEPVRLTVRMGVHAGEVIERDGNVFGDPVNRCARIRGLAHGGQVLVSGTTKDLVEMWPPEGVGFLDLGEHRMKDLTAAVRIYQVTHPDLPVDFPPLVSLNRARHNLPVQLSSFVGQQQAVADVVRLVAAHPLVTVTGFGGMGKTRLALQVAAELADGEGDGVWFVDLSATRDPELVPEAVARVLEVRVEGDPLRGLLARLKDKQVLLVCDNVEQLLPGSAPTLGALAGAGPGVRVLATSREPVGVRGERVYPMRPLTSPVLDSTPMTVDSLDRFDAARLFIARAEAADPAFAVDESTAPALAAICARLDGWPLALELAAARVRLLGLPRLLDRLTDRLGVLTGGSRDAPDRQRTLRETITWSYDLLSAAEQALLARLSVFTGGATLEAIEAVCGPALDADVVEALGSLLDKSLVRQDEARGGTRFRLLETVRDFAQEQLPAAAESDGLRARHARFFYELYPTSEAGPVPGEGFEEEIPNLRAAMEHLADHDPDTAARLLLTVDMHMFAVGEFRTTEGLNALLRDRDVTAANRAGLEVDRAVHRYYQGEREGLVPALRDATATLVELRENQLMACRGARLTASLLAENGDGAEAMRWATQAIAISEWSPHPRAVIEALIGAAYVARLSGHLEHAVEFARRAVDAVPADGPRTPRAHALGELCRCLVAAHDVDEALRVGRRAVEMAQPTGGMALAFPLGCYSQALLLAGRPREALSGFLDAMRTTRDAGVDPYELGWTAVALLPFAPEAGASVLGAADGLFARTRDSDLYPPEDVLGPARAVYEARYAEHLARGLEIGWPHVVTLLDALDLPGAEDGPLP